MSETGNHLQQLTPAEVGLAGAASGFLTRTIAQPLDVLKIRFQLQVEPINRSSSSSKYRSLVQATALIWKEEGVAAFWKGLVPAQLLSVTYGWAQFWAFEASVQMAKEHNLYQYPVISNFGCGAFAGSFASFMAFPFDIMRTRLVAQSESKKFYRGILPASLHIIKHEGPLGFYKGLTPTLLAVTPNAGYQFMFYKLFDQLYVNIFSVAKDSYNVTGHLVSGSMAGFCAKVLVYPLDLVRKRMQIQGFQAQRGEFGAPFVCNGFVDCFAKIVKGEGFLGLFKGIAPSILKAVVTSSLSFTTFEIVCLFLKSTKH